VAERSADGAYKLLGRSSSDIIKSAGYKISALEIERELLSHPQVSLQLCSNVDSLKTRLRINKLYPLAHDMSC
jgi:malonyl-CoA/methylmalonyl-CoA synthetase